MATSLRIGAVLAEEPKHEDLLAAAFEDHYEALRRFAYARLDPGSADDVASETFARAVALWPRFDPARGSLRAWLFGIATNICREQDRARRRRFGAIGRLSANTAATQTRDPATDRVEDVATILEVMSRLRAPVREALLLVEGMELSYEEAAQALGIPLGTVASRVSTGRRQIAAWFSAAERATAAKPRRKP